MTAADSETDRASEDDHARTVSRRVVAKLVVFVAIVAIAVATGLLVDLPSVEQVQTAADELGWWSLAVFALLYGAITMTPAPKSVISIAAGAVFGFWTALPVVLLGALLSATGSFFLGKALGRGAVEKFTGQRVDKVDRLLSDRGLVAVLGVRMVPVIPFMAVNYASGLTGLRRRDYILGSAIGMIPGVVAWVAIGAFGLELGPPFWIAVSALGILTATAGLVAWKARKAESDA
ncbi:putative membrane protein YdjX (TVP38/TMEM64 family) [Microcella alkaliphila]|uniref:TVP38/TMEM64 family membrane protein n=1 Tax=Microcella alkaliphila TaxID=279828 RepID=A0A4Q7TFX3_9MICO|nr:TVP38/TMEM64 family protein [Microcella alkaliphila]RZT59376.1 putative membrane protein YdjX (TVP38/TMEM64 family) [Microcella alkaliphila]